MNVFIRVISKDGRDIKIMETRFSHLFKDFIIFDRHWYALNSKDRRISDYASSYDGSSQDVGLLS